MTKKLILSICLAVLLLNISAAAGQDQVRVKCDRFTVNVPSSNVRCLQIDSNIPVSESATADEIANAQVAGISVYFSDYSTLMSSIKPQITFYLVDDLGKTSFSLLDNALELSDIMNNLNADFESLNDVSSQIPFLPYQAAERTVNALPAKLDFENGSGIRSIAVFDNTISAVSGNSNLYYSFQGISADEKYYVSAVIPLRSAVVNGRSAGDVDWSTLSPADFQPSLDELDYYMRSIVIE